MFNPESRTLSLETLEWQAERALRMILGIDGPVPMTEEPQKYRKLVFSMFGLRHGRWQGMLVWTICVPMCIGITYLFLLCLFGPSFGAPALPWATIAVYASFLAVPALYVRGPYRLGLVAFTCAGLGTGVLILGHYFV